MKRFLAAAVMAVLVTGVPAAGSPPRENVLFEESFTDKLGEGWAWIREDPQMWRLDMGALVVRTSTGHIFGGSNDAKNVLLRPLPRTGRPLAIEVHVDSDPMVGFEHAGLVWYVDDDNFVALYQEVLDGKIVLQMVIEKEGKARFAVARHETTSVWLRLLNSAGMITSQYRLSERAPWRDVGEGEIPASGPARAGVVTGGAPKGARRYVRFRDFRIVEITKI
jgi:regulation of enolase protein 1 (concanavalin A-like superfamily)